MFTRVTVTRDYDLADGTGPAGTVSFTPSAWLTNGGATVVAAPVVAALDVDGRISIDLVTNTDPDTTPTDSYYTVQEEIVGQPRRSYRITIPSSLAGFTVELDYLETPPAPLGGYGIDYGIDYGGVGAPSGYGTGGYGTSEYGV